MAEPLVTRDETCCAGEHRHESKERFTKHGSVADERRISFLVELFSGRSRRNQRVKAACGTAGNDNEHERIDGRRTGWACVKRRGDKLGIGNHQSGVHAAESKVQQQTVDVVAWLQQHPYG